MLTTLCPKLTRDLFPAPQLSAPSSFSVHEVVFPLFPRTSSFFTLPLLFSGALVGPFPHHPHTCPCSFRPFFLRDGSAQFRDSLPFFPLEQPRRSLPFLDCRSRGVLQSVSPATVHLSLWLFLHRMFDDLQRTRVDSCPPLFLFVFCVFCAQNFFFDRD